MKLNRKQTSLKKMTKDDDCFMKASPEKRIAFIWELTAELWSLRGVEDVERRLQRNVANFIRQ
ncbi:MAG: hypothetical protein ABIF11_00970 [Nitrospirota bacterium]